MNRLHYIDAAGFTRLFQQRRHNHQAICLGLSLIVAGVARRFAYGSADDRGDVEQATLAHCIERIDRFDDAAGGNAFAYYTTVAFNQVREQLRARRRQLQRVRSFSDFDVAA